MLRPLLMTAVVVLTCWLSTTLSQHHEGGNEEAFVLLFKHVEPAPLVVHHEAGGGSAGHGAEAGGHGGEDALLKIALPSFLAAIDWNDDPSDGVHAVLFNLQLFQLCAVALIFIAFAGVPGYLRSGRGDALTRFFAGTCMFVRDGMMAPYMDRDSVERFLPLFLALFFFIAFMNLLGLVPGSATATASIYVTGGLALISFGVMVGSGMAIQGPVGFWKSLVPHVPGWLWPLMLVVELIGLLVKPFALMVRLFANMTGGHLVVLSFLGLIFFFAGAELSPTAYAVAPVALAFSVFIMIIECFVALVQAYIFAQLSIIFVGMCIHPEH